MQSVDQIA